MMLKTVALRTTFELYTRFFCFSPDSDRFIEELFNFLKKKIPLLKTLFLNIENDCNTQKGCERTFVTLRINTLNQSSR